MRVRGYNRILIGRIGFMRRPSSPQWLGSASYSAVATQFWRAASDIADDQASADLCPVLQPFVGKVRV